MDRCCRPYCSETQTWRTATFLRQLVECQRSLQFMFWITLKYTTQLDCHFPYIWVFSLFMYFLGYLLCIENHFILPQFVFCYTKLLSVSQTWRLPPRCLEVVLTQKKTAVFSSNSFSCCPSSVHEYMSCLCFSASVSGYWAWLRRVFNGNAMQEKAMWQSWIYVHP